jgi:hypothetical protein
VYSIGVGVTDALLGSPGVYGWMAGCLAILLLDLWDEIHHD